MVNGPSAVQRQRSTSHKPQAHGIIVPPSLCLRTAAPPCRGLFHRIEAMSTALLTNPIQASHNEPRHVERAARLRAIEMALTEAGLYERVLLGTAMPATEAQILAVHHPRLLEKLSLTRAQERLWIDGDTYTTSRSFDVALAGAGAAIEAARMVGAGQASNAFALVRPPGHHATPSRSMGFCLVNNIAIAAHYALDTFGYERVAIVDIDVHHGNGTQDIFYADPQVLFCSSHAAPLYPGTGAESEIGSGAGLGTTLNMPVPYGAGDTAMTSLYEQVVVPAVRRFQPQLILVSAGFDGHWNDPLGPLALTVNGYAALIQLLSDLANDLCDGRIVLVLEGGYNEEALGSCVVAAMRVLLGEPFGEDPLGPAGTPEPDLRGLIARLYQNHPILRAY